MLKRLLITAFWNAALCGAWTLHQIETCLGAHA